MGSNRRRRLGLFVAVGLSLPAGRAAALVDGITYAGSNCVGANWEAEHFAQRGVGDNSTSIVAGVNTDTYRCSLPSRPIAAGQDHGVRASVAVRGMADCVLWVANVSGVFIDADFKDTATVAPGTPNLLTFEALKVDLMEDAVFTISCQLPNGSAIDSYTFMQCLDDQCDAVEQANVCGNGVKELTEGCDDGNRVSDDTCSNTCVAATCTDHVKNHGETAPDCGGPNCNPCSQPTPLSAALPGGAFQTPANNAIDNNLATRFTNDGNLGTASIQLQAAQATTFTGVRLAMYQGGVRTYPLRIAVDGTQVFNGSTQTAADYWNASFPATHGNTVTVTMTGANSAGTNWLSIWEAQPLGFHDPTCSDGLQNHGEAGIDCGGPCTTPCGERSLEIFTATAGGAVQTPAVSAIDASSTTRYTNDNTLASAKLTVQLQRQATLSGLQLLMYNGTNRVYPIQVTVGNTVVFTGSTAISAGYWPLSFAPTVGDKVSVTMTGANSAGTNWFSVFEEQVRGTPLQTGPATCQDGLLTAGEDGVDCGGLCPDKCIHLLTPAGASASSVESATFAASKAIDGSTSTRWSSAFSDPQWLSANLGAARHVEQVNVRWENATSADYDIQVSQAATGPWTTLRTVTNPSSGSRVDQAKYLGATGRYVRLFSRARSTGYGNSILELETLGYE